MDDGWQPADGGEIFLSCWIRKIPFRMWEKGAERSGSYAMQLQTRDRQTTDGFPAVLLDTSGRPKICNPTCVSWRVDYKPLPAGQMFQDGELYEKREELEQGRTEGPSVRPMYRPVCREAHAKSTSRPCSSRRLNWCKSDVARGHTDRTSVFRQRRYFTDNPVHQSSSLDHQGSQDKGSAVVYTEGVR